MPVGDPVFRQPDTSELAVGCPYIPLKYLIDTRFLRGSYLNLCVQSRYRETSMSDVVSMGPAIIRLGIRLEAISFNHSVRILHHLLFYIFRAPML
jgi:hypothetical protein